MAMRIVLHQLLFAIVVLLLLNTSFTAIIARETTACKKTAVCLCNDYAGSSITICLDNASKECTEWAKNCQGCKGLLADSCRSSAEHTRSKRQYLVDPRRRGILPYSASRTYTEENDNEDCRLEAVRSINGYSKSQCATRNGATRCEIRCNGPTFSNDPFDDYPFYSDEDVTVHFCVPGRSWEPPLPLCVRPKSKMVLSLNGTNENPSTPSCRCETRGECGKNGVCVCPMGWTGARCQYKCGNPVIDMKTINRVLFGSKTVAGEWPWVVAIAVEKGNTREIVCGGALIDRQTVITAAHCIVEPPFFLYFGKQHREDRHDDSDVLVAQSNDIIIHPDYNDVNFDADIAIIKFAPRISFSDRVKPICLPTKQSNIKNMIPDRNGYVVGWGKTELDLMAKELLLARLPVMNHNECQESYKKRNNSITRNMFCVGLPQNQQSVCVGDSGSPFVFLDSDTNRYILEGLVSFGVQGQCGLPGKHAVFTKVVRYVQWILENL